MQELTSRERFTRMYEHREADRIPIIDSPWAATLERWVGEGMPKGMSFVEYFGLDRVETISRLPLSMGGPRLMVRPGRQKGETHPLPEKIMNKILKID